MRGSSNIMYKNISSQKRNKKQKEGIIKNELIINIKKENAARILVLLDSYPFLKKDEECLENAAQVLNKVYPLDTSNDDLNINQVTNKENQDHVEEIKRVLRDDNLQMTLGLPRNLLNYKGNYKNLLIERIKDALSFYKEGNKDYLEYLGEENYKDCILALQSIKKSADKKEILEEVLKPYQKKAFLKTKKILKIIDGYDYKTSIGPNNEIHLLKKENSPLTLCDLKVNSLNGPLPKGAIHAASSALNSQDLHQCKTCKEKSPTHSAFKTYSKHHHLNDDDKKTISENVVEAVYSLLEKKDPELAELKEVMDQEINNGYVKVLMKKAGKTDKERCEFLRGEKVTKREVQRISDDYLQEVLEGNIWNATRFTTSVNGIKKFLDSTYTNNRHLLLLKRGGDLNF